VGRASERERGGCWIDDRGEGSVGEREEGRPTVPDAGWRELRRAAAGGHGVRGVDSARDRKLAEPPCRTRSSGPRPSPAALPL
jgi:hypothetical protein